MSNIVDIALPNYSKVSLSPETRNRHVRYLHRDIAPTSSMTVQHRCVRNDCGRDFVNDVVSFYFLVHKPKTSNFK